MRQSAVIENIASYLPEREIANSYFAGRLDTSDEWIKSRTGVSTRYWAEPNVCTSYLDRVPRGCSLDDHGSSQRAG